MTVDLAQNSVCSKLIPMLVSSIHFVVAHSPAIVIALMSFDLVLWDLKLRVTGADFLVACLVTSALGVAVAEGRFRVRAIVCDSSEVTPAAPD